MDLMTAFQPFLCSVCLSPFGHTDLHRPPLALSRSSSTSIWNIHISLISLWLTPILVPPRSSLLVSPLPHLDLYLPVAPQYPYSRRPKPHLHLSHICQRMCYKYLLGFWPCVTHRRILNTLF